MSRAYACFLINISHLLRKAETVAAKGEEWRILLHTKHAVYCPQTEF